MKTTCLPGAATSLGDFLRNRRERLRPEAQVDRKRRTPGLRREEVAAKAGVSVTWYTWLEQGRGGPPSNEVLERLARALELDDAGREVLFFLGQQRPPPIKPVSLSAVAPALQRVLDAMPATPAYVKTLTWDIIGWNTAAAVLNNLSSLPASERNVLRRLFTQPALRDRLSDWEMEARFAVATFRLDAARAGDNPKIAALVAELQATSADFRRLWAENETSRHGVHIRRIQHPTAGPLTFECSVFHVESGEGLSILVYTPASPADADAISALLSPRALATTVSG